MCVFYFIAEAEKTKEIFQGIFGGIAVAFLIVGVGLLYYVRCKKGKLHSILGVYGQKAININYVQ